MSKFPSFSDIVTTTLRNHTPELINNLSKNNSVLKHLANSMHWRDSWRKAVENMPWKTNPDSSQSYKWFEKREALAKCLGVREIHIMRGVNEGYEPKRAKHRALLRQLAGHYGTQLAAIRLANLGVLSEYPHWPAP